MCRRKEQARVPSPPGELTDAHSRGETAAAAITADYVSMCPRPPVPFALRYDLAVGRARLDRPRRAALRRHLRRAARHPLSRREARTTSSISRCRTPREGRRARPRRVARSRRVLVERAGVTGGSRRTTSARTASAAPRGLRRARSPVRRTPSARCCRTSARTPARRRGACALLRATRTQLEPIFLLYDGDPVARAACGGPPTWTSSEGGVRRGLAPAGRRAPTTRRS